jgi:hypothetical protein
MKALVKEIDSKVRMEAVELTAEELELGVQNKIQYTDIKTNKFFFVYEMKKGFVKSEIFQG